MSDPSDHDLGGFHQRRGCLTFAELHLARGIGGDDRGNALVADGEDDLGEQSADLDFNDLSNELIASADLAEALASLLRLRSGFEERNQSAARNEVMASGRPDAGELAGKDPLLDRRIAEPEFGGCFARFEERIGGRNRAPRMNKLMSSLARRRG